MADTRKGRRARREPGRVKSQAAPRPAQRQRSRELDLGPLNEHLGFALRRAQLSLFADFIASLNEVDLKPGQFSVMMVIRHNPGSRQSEICRALGIQKANFVPLLKGLEQRGLIVRNVRKSDRRAHALFLTEAGEALLQRACALQAQCEARLTEQLGQRDRDVLLDLLNRLTGIAPSGSKAPDSH